LVWNETLQTGLADVLLNHLTLLFFLATPYLTTIESSSSILSTSSSTSTTSISHSSTPAALGFAASSSHPSNPFLLVGQKLLDALQRRPPPSFQRPDCANSIATELLQLLDSMQAFAPTLVEPTRSSTIQHSSSQPPASINSQHLASHSTVDLHEGMFLLLLDCFAFKPLAKLLLSDHALWTALSDPQVVASAQRVWETSRAAQSITQMPKFLQVRLASSV
jgi:hypothetical protein